MNRPRATAPSQRAAPPASRTPRPPRALTLACLVALAAASTAAPPPAAVVTTLQRYCVECHDAELQKGDLNLQSLEKDDLTRHAGTWEKVVRKLQARQMPPAGRERPTERTYRTTVAALASALDLAAERRPDPGRTETFRRLNRTEYRNAIRDLLALEIDAAGWLPKDDASHGFDNVGAGTLSPTLLNRYLAAAEKISRLALGTPQRAPGGETFRAPPDLTQEEPVEGMPAGTRGGLLVHHSFPRDAEYEITVRLTRDRNEEVEGLRERHELVVLVDREPVRTFPIAPPTDRNFDRVDAHLKVRLPVQAGPHEVGVTFVKNPSALLETRRQPYRARFNMHRHPRLGPAVYQVSINGPYDAQGPGDTPSRRRILGDPGTVRANEEDEARAGRLLGGLLRRAYRRPIQPSDLQGPLDFFRRARAEGGFEAGMEAALTAVLVSPEFLFRVERDPAGLAPGTVYRVGDVELASRLSFFLWSSLPDEPLLAAAERGELRRPAGLERETRRMLADPRATNLAVNFADQWLHLRNLETITPDLRLFPDFDDNLRQAFRRETELHFETLLREDRSVLDLLQADYTFLNERLAQHYGIPHVQGSWFRRVALDPGSRRGGLLRQGSVLTVTSYATRTSPTLRGKWVLGNLLGTPPPPPLPNVPALRDATVAAGLSVRERLAQHRADPQCASCHDLIDPPGFALENYDAIGRWRVLEEGRPIDAGGGLPDGSRFTGVAALEAGLRQHPEWFATTLTEKLLTFALGRGLTPADGPAVRRIVREAAQDRFRLSAILLGIVRSPPFTQRKAP